MTKRTPVALALALALALAAWITVTRPAPAQTPDDEPISRQPRVVTEEQVVQQVTFIEDPGAGGAIEWSECEPACCGAQEGRGWFTFDILIGWIENGNLPPLVTTSPQGTPQTSAGVPGKATTGTVIGGHVNEDARWGLGLAAGYWLDCNHIWAIEVGAESFESEATNIGLASNGNPILARPFNNTSTGNPDSVLVAFPGISNGTVSIRASSGDFYEAHFDLTENFYNCGGLRFDALLGYRFYRYDESLVMGQTVSPVGTAFTPGTKISTMDNFGTQNEFHGGDIGIKAQYCMGSLLLGMVAKAAVGSIHQEVDIHGSQTVTVPGVAPATSPGGVYALISNSGKHGSDDWTFMPEVGVTASWQASSHLNLHLGYSVLYMERIARPADQIDFNINPAFFPPATAPVSTTSTPAFNLERSDVWLQSLKFGVEIRF